MHIVSNEMVINIKSEGCIHVLPFIGARKMPFLIRKLTHNDLQQNAVNYKKSIILKFSLHSGIPS